MQTEASPFDNVSTKLIACAVIVACLALGVIGLILPIVPGLLFIAIAAVVAAKLFPAVDRVLRQNSTIGGYLDKTDGIAGLPLAEKVRAACLLCLKMLIDSVALLVSAVMKVVKAAERA